MARFAVWMFVAIACQYVVLTNGRATTCKMIVDKPVLAWPFNYWEYSDDIQNDRKDLFISIRLTVDSSDLRLYECGGLNFADFKACLPYNCWNIVNSILNQTTTKSRHTVHLKIDPLSEIKFELENGGPLQLRYSLNYPHCNFPVEVKCFDIKSKPSKVFLKYDHVPKIHFQRKKNDSDHSTVLKNGTQVIWKVNSSDTLAVDVRVQDTDVFDLNPNRYEYSAISGLSVKFTVLVQFFNESLDHVDVSAADSDALSAKRPLGTRSSNCTQLAWCAESELNLSSVNQGLVEYRWNVTTLNLAVQELYNNSDLSNPRYVRVYVTMEAFATSGTTYPLTTLEKLTVTVLLPQSLQAAVVGKSSETLTSGYQRYFNLSKVFEVFGRFFQFVSTYMSSLS